MKGGQKEGGRERVTQKKWQRDRERHFQGRWQTVSSSGGPSCQHLGEKEAEEREGRREGGREGKKNGVCFLPLCRNPLFWFPVS